MAQADGRRCHEAGAKELRKTVYTVPKRVYVSFAISLYLQILQDMPIHGLNLPAAWRRGSLVSRTFSWIISSTILLHTGRDVTHKIGQFLWDLCTHRLLARVVFSCSQCTENGRRCKTSNGSTCLAQNQCCIRSQLDAGIIPTVRSGLLYLIMV